jgi:3-oxoadipate enol-lactonase
MSTHFHAGLAVEIDGTGEPVLCIHGLGGSSNTWTPLLPAFEGRQLIRPDLPGSARSALPGDGTPLSIAAYVSSLVALLDALQLGAVRVVAHSLGTIVAQHLAVAHPARVTSLALFGPLAAPPDAARPNIVARAGVARSGAAGMQEIANAIVQGATGRETKAQQPAVLALVRESVMRQPAEGYAQSCLALAEAQPAAVEQLRVPVLLLTGDQDGVAPVAAVTALAGRIAGSQLQVVEACGHWTTFEQPQVCVSALQRFHADVG